MNPSSTNENRCDVAVIGAGPQGLMYSTWLKKNAPHLRVVILERQPNPGHKIGESTLSGFCKSLRSVGIPHRAMQRMFFPKNGLGFFFGTGYKGELVDTDEYIIEAFDETFQVERRALEHLIEANTERFGVDIVRGAKVDINASSFGKNGNVLRYVKDGESHVLHARLVADASGPACLLGRHFGVYVPGGLGFQASSVWAYYKNIPLLEEYPGWKKHALHSRDQYTQHVYFREGWMWYIPIWSWQHVSDETLHAMAARLLQDPDASLDDLTPGAPPPKHEQIVSIGFVVRNDRDPSMDKGPAAVFEHYAREVPLTAKILEQGELISGHYPGHNPYMVRRNFHHHTTQAAGDGWLLLGDASFFVDPLASPGLTGGAAASYQAHRYTLKALAKNDVSRESLSGYDEFCKVLQPAIEREIQNIYLSFNHPGALDIVLRLQEIDARRHFGDYAENDYDIEDTNIWGILDPTYQKMQISAWNIMRDAERRVAEKVPYEQQNHTHYEGMVRDLEPLLREYVTEYIDLTPYAVNNPGDTPDAHTSP